MSLLQRITINKKKIIMYAGNREMIFKNNKSKLYKYIIRMSFSSQGYSKKTIKVFDCSWPLIN